MSKVTYIGYDKYIYLISEYNDFTPIPRIGEKVIIDNISYRVRDVIYSFKSGSTDTVIIVD